MSSERNKWKNHFSRPLPGPHWELLLVVRSLGDSLLQLYKRLWSFWDNFGYLKCNEETAIPLQSCLSFWGSRGGELYIVVRQSNAVTGTRTAFYSHAREESSKGKTEGQQMPCWQDTHLLPEKQAVEVFDSTEWITFQINLISSRNTHLKTLPSS